MESLSILGEGGRSPTPQENTPADQVEKDLPDSHTIFSIWAENLEESGNVTVLP